MSFCAQYAVRGYIVHRCMPMRSENSLYFHSCHTRIQRAFLYGRDKQKHLIQSSNTSSMCFFSGYRFNEPAFIHPSNGLTSSVKRTKTVGNALLVAAWLLAGSHAALRMVEPHRWGLPMITNNRGGTFAWANQLIPFSRHQLFMISAFRCHGPLFSRVSRLGSVQDRPQEQRQG